MSHLNTQPYVAEQDPTVRETAGSVVDEVSVAQKKLADEERQTKEQAKIKAELKKKALFDATMKNIIKRKDREIIVFEIPKNESQESKQFVISEIMKAFTDKYKIYVLWSDPKLKGKYMYSQVSSKISLQYDMKNEFSMFAIEYESSRQRVFANTNGEIDMKYIKKIAK